MTWLVEQSEDTSAVTVNGNTIICRKEDFFGSPINVLYKDPADRNGDYFWEINVSNVDSQGGGTVSVGITNDQSFKSGWGLKAMKYLGNLSDGSSLLVQRFGEQIKQGDKVGILLRLTDADLKMYIFHNDKPLGLAFHTQAPYSKPLYPVVSFDANGQVTINRSQRLPTNLDRGGSHFQGVEGHWRLVNYSQHPECVGFQFEIKHSEQGENQYTFHGRVINHLNTRLEYYPTSNQWKTSPVMSTMMGGPPAEMNKEQIINSLISSIQRLDLNGQTGLTITTNNGEQVQCERFAPQAPSPVTTNIFN